MPSSSFSDYLKAAGVSINAPELLAAQLAGSIGPAFGCEAFSLVGANNAGVALQFPTLHAEAQASGRLLGGFVVRSIHNADAAQLVGQLGVVDGPMPLVGHVAVGNVGGQTFEPLLGGALSIAQRNGNSVAYPTMGARVCPINIAAGASIRCAISVPRGSHLALSTDPAGALGLPLRVTLACEMVPFQLPVVP